MVTKIPITRSRWTPRALLLAHCLLKVWCAPMDVADNTYMYTYTHNMSILLLKCYIVLVFRGANFRVQRLTIFVWPIFLSCTVSFSTLDLLRRKRAFVFFLMPPVRRIALCHIVHCVYNRPRTLSPHIFTFSIQDLHSTWYSLRIKELPLGHI
jgi:hypothetical protein